MRILIVEDDESFTYLLTRFLAPIANKEQPPIIATNMTDAMKVINSVSPLDLIMQDLSLPDSVTPETLAKLKEIKRLRPDALLVVITGAMQPGIEEEAIKLGADGFMHKQETCTTPSTFLKTLYDIGRSIMRQPVRYQKNLPLLEKLTEKICEHVACRTQPQTNP